MFPDEYRRMLGDIRTHTRVGDTRDDEESLQESPNSQGGDACYCHCQSEDGQERKGADY